MYSCTVCMCIQLMRSIERTFVACSGWLFSRANVRLLDCFDRLPLASRIIGPNRRRLHNSNRVHSICDLHSPSLRCVLREIRLARVRTVAAACNTTFRALRWPVQNRVAFASRRESGRPHVASGGRRELIACAVAPDSITLLYCTVQPNVHRMYCTIQQYWSCEYAGRVAAARRAATRSRVRAARRRTLLVPAAG